jgi:transcriptional antiterminator NusG
VVEVRRGQKVDTDRKLLPGGYVLVKMEMTDDAWHLVKDTPKVDGPSWCAQQAPAGAGF